MASSIRSGSFLRIAAGQVDPSIVGSVREMQQYLWLAQLQAVENRRMLVRCAAIGISCLVQPDGAISARLPPQQSGMIVACVPLIQTQAIYTRYGDWFAFLATDVSIVGIIAMKSANRRAAKEAWSDR